MSNAERRLRAQIIAHQSWARTENRSARTRAAREAAEARFLKLAGGDPKRAASLRKAHFANMTLKSIEARRRKGVAA